MPIRSAAVLDRITDRIEGMSSLDAPAQKFAAAGSWLKPGRLKDLLSGTPLAHPLHPVLVAVPIGAWSAATVLDASGADDREVNRLIGIGLVAAAPTIATGFSDWLETNRAEQRVGLVHAAAMDLAVGLMGASWWARRRGNRVAGMALSAAGGAVLVVGGWLGGHLSYALGVGVDTTAFQHAPEEWTDVLAESELADARPHQGTADGVPVLLVRHEGRIRALADRCTHRGAPLSDGHLNGSCVVCPWHSSEFDVTNGEVVQGPATRPQPAYEVRVVEGRVQVRRSAEERSLRTNPAGV